ncbi:UTP--glucose-1-phosphate uridylyltransferase [Sediminibacillus massiliensis]|uniref:UTP--glucose-1-phosphate uridylyltransferase n=1 Tax=Sediminibacillus massiliensis TaxID=1926277 RepID=UPI0009887120|nr:UTP--glucose-1-phosphate uridylyltransferase [Sediminibacillus massiliensis]
MVKKAIIPAAGYGTRSLPITKAVPKEMFPVWNKPAIQIVVEEAVEAGIEEILIIVSRRKNVIIDYFDRSVELESHLKKVNKSHLLDEQEPPAVNIHYVRQPYARGLGDAVLLGKSFAGNDPFAILLPDDIIVNGKTSGLSQLVEIRNKHKGNVLALKEIPLERLHKYGVVKAEQKEESLYKIMDIVEKPLKDPPSRMAVIGRYLLNPDIFSYLEQVKPGAGGEIQLTDAIRMLIKDQPCFGKVIEGKRFDIGSFEEYLALNEYMYQNGQKS